MTAASAAICVNRGCTLHASKCRSHYCCTTHQTEVTCHSTVDDARAGQTAGALVNNCFHPHRNHQYHHH